MIKFLDLEKQLTPDSSTPQEQASENQGADSTTPSELPVEAAVEAPYEVCMNGPLTYFRYYFEEVTSTPEPLSSKPRIGVMPLSTGLVGAGIVIASAAVGFTAVKSMQNDVTPAQVKSRKSHTDENSSKTSPPSLSAVEQIESYAKQQTTPLKQISPIDNRVETPLQRFSVDDRLAPAPQNSRSTKQLSQPVKAPPTTEAAVQQAELRLASRVLPRVALAQANELPVPQSRDRVSSPAKSDVQAVRKLTNNPKPEATPTLQFSRQSASPVVAPKRAENTAENLKNTASSKQLIKAPKLAENTAENLKNTAPSEQLAKADTTIALTNDRASKTAVQSQLLNSLKGIQDFINLPKIAPQGAAVTLLPLTSQVVSEIETITQLEQFAILRLRLPDYQTQWLQSSGSASASGLPAYGFIDYQRQAIVVLQN